jgi:sec-independent protein translocase protein TatB
MLNLDPAKLLVIAVVAIILLGPDRLPQVARQIGGAWRSFNEFRHRMESEVRSNMPDLPSTSEIARLARSPSALLNHLSNMADDGEDADEGDEHAEQGLDGAVVAGTPGGDGSAVAAGDDTVVPTSAETNGAHAEVDKGTGAYDTAASTNGNGEAPVGSFAAPDVSDVDEVRAPSSSRVGEPTAPGDPNLN